MRSANALTAQIVNGAIINRNLIVLDRADTCSSGICHSYIEYFEILCSAVALKLDNHA